MRQCTATTDNQAESCNGNSAVELQAASASAKLRQLTQSDKRIEIKMKIVPVPSPRVGFCGFSPPKQNIKPLNLNMKDYIQGKILSNFQCQALLHKRKATLLKTFWRLFVLVERHFRSKNN